VTNHGGKHWRPQSKVQKGLKWSFFQLAHFFWDTKQTLSTTWLPNPTL
jgi:hypothetical protein